MRASGTVSPFSVCVCLDATVKRRCARSRLSSVDVWERKLSKMASHTATSSGAHNVDVVTHHQQQQQQQTRQQHYHHNRHHRNSHPQRSPPTNDIISTIHRHSSDSSPSSSPSHRLMTACGVVVKSPAAMHCTSTTEAASRRHATTNTARRASATSAAITLSASASSLLPASPSNAASGRLQACTNTPLDQLRHSAAEYRHHQHHHHHHHHHSTVIHPPPAASASPDRTGARRRRYHHRSVVMRLPALPSLLTVGLAIAAMLAALAPAIVGAFVLDGSQSSFAQFRKWYSGLNGTVEFEFKTEQPNGLVLYTDDGGTFDFFEIKLVEGTVRLRYNLGGGANIITVGRDLHDGLWHKVQVSCAAKKWRRGWFSAPCDVQCVCPLCVRTPEELPQTKQIMVLLHHHDRRKVCEGTRVCVREARRGGGVGKFVHFMRARCVRACLLRFCCGGPTFVLLGDRAASLSVIQKLYVQRILWARICVCVALLSTNGNRFACESAACAWQGNICGDRVRRQLRTHKVLYWKSLVGCARGVLTFLLRVIGFFSSRACTSIEKPPG